MKMIFFLNKNRMKKSFLTLFLLEERTADSFSLTVYVCVVHSLMFGVWLLDQCVSLAWIISSK